MCNLRLPMERKSTVNIYYIDFFFFFMDVDGFKEMKLTNVWWFINTLTDVKQNLFSMFL